MDFQSLHEILNKNIDKGMINTASAFARIDDENKKLAKRMDDEEERKYKKITDGVQKQISLLEDNLKQSQDSYNKLNELYQLKNQELEEKKKELESSKKYNKKMYWIALASGVVSLLSLIATITISYV